MLSNQIRRAQELAARIPQWEQELASACKDEPAVNLQALIEENAKLRSEAYTQWLAAHCMICGPRYPGQHALNYAAPHADGEHCYWPRKL